MEVFKKLVKFKEFPSATSKVSEHDLIGTVLGVARTKRLQ
jgi:hypothetical protein